MFTIRGKVIHTYKESGKSTNGEWKRTTVVLDTGSNFRNTAPITFFDGDFSVKQGDEVEIDFYLGGHEYNGKYYPDVDGKNLRKVSNTKATPKQPEPITAGDEDDLPF